MAAEPPSQTSLEFDIDQQVMEAANEAGKQEVTYTREKPRKPHPGLLALDGDKVRLPRTPLRQIYLFKMDGVRIHPNTLNYWISLAAVHVRLLYAVDKAYMLGSNYLQADVYTIKILDRDKPGATLRPGALSSSSTRGGRYRRTLGQPARFSTSSYRPTSTSCTKRTTRERAWCTSCAECAPGV